MTAVNEDLVAQRDAQARDLNALEHLLSSCCGRSIINIAEQILSMSERKIVNFLTDIIVRCNARLSERGFNDEEAELVTRSLLHWIADTRAALHRRRVGTLS